MSGCDGTLFRYFVNDFAMVPFTPIITGNTFIPTSYILHALYFIIIITIITIGVGLRSLDCWDCTFESRPGHGCSSVVFVVCCVSSGLCDELITRSEESYRVWCVCLCVMRKPQQRGGVDPSWAVAPQKIIIIIIIIIIIGDLFYFIFILLT
jgi:hypothetical protein